MGPAVKSQQKALKQEVKDWGNRKTVRTVVVMTADEEEAKTLPPEIGSVNHCCPFPTS